MKASRVYRFRVNKNSLPHHGWGAKRILKNIAKEISKNGIIGAMATEGIARPTNRLFWDSSSWGTIRKTS